MRAGLGGAARGANPKGAGRGRRGSPSEEACRVGLRGREARRREAGDPRGARPGEGGAPACGEGARAGAGARGAAGVRISGRPFHRGSRRVLLELGVFSFRLVCVVVH